MYDQRMQKYQSKAYCSYEKYSSQNVHYTFVIYVQQNKTQHGVVLYSCTEWDAGKKK